jgi:hypothetical protein
MEVQPKSPPSRHGHPSQALRLQSCRPNFSLSVYSIWTLLLNWLLLTVFGWRKTFLQFYCVSIKTINFMFQNETLYTFFIIDNWKELVKESLSWREVYLRNVHQNLRQIPLWSVHHIPNQFTPGVYQVIITYDKVLRVPRCVCLWYFYMHALKWKRPNVLCTEIFVSIIGSYGI